MQWWSYPSTHVSQIEQCTPLYDQSALQKKQKYSRLLSSFKALAITLVNVPTGIYLVRPGFIPETIKNITADIKKMIPHQMGT